MHQYRACCATREGERASQGKLWIAEGIHDIQLQLHNALTTSDVVSIQLMHQTSGTRPPVTPNIFGMKI